MKPPTKFELMRNNRYMWESAPRVQIVEPAQVPTMEIDGVKYREFPSVAHRICKGCAFQADHLCRLPGGWGSGNNLIKTAFGGSCSDRNVIYIRAE